MWRAEYQPIFLGLGGSAGVREFSGVPALAIGGSLVTLVLANWCWGGLCGAGFVGVSISGFEVWPCVCWAAKFFCNFFEGVWFVV